MNCFSALLVSLCGPDKLQAIHQTETKFNSDNSDIGFLEINLSTDGGRVSTKCRRNPGFLPERGFLVRIIPREVLLNFQPVPIKYFVEKVFGGDRY